MKVQTILLITLLALSLTNCQQTGDWVDPFKLPLQFMVPGFYAGYLNINNNKHLYYVLQQSQSNPSKDPLIVRISPGPGCSSLYDWIYSMGKFIFTPNTPNLALNQYNWNKNANVLFIEGPAGVGNSINPNNQTNYNDQIVSQQMIYALYAFYLKFPQLKDQQLYLTGQVYAGAIIPRMAKWIIQKNNDRDTPAWQRINLKGFLLQNPCTLEDQCTEANDYNHYFVQFLKNHYFISKQMYHKYMTICGTDRTSAACIQILHKIESRFVSASSDRNNLYRQCSKQTGQAQYYRCMDTLGALAYFNNQDVRQDMHISPQLTQWQICNFNIMSSYQRSNGTLHVYQQLLRQQHNLRIWIVSGILSPQVPTLSTRRWFESLKQTLKRNSIRLWDAWQYDNDVNAGQIEQFRGMTFLTIRNSGSKVYRDNPQIGYYVLQSFINGKQL